jgi:hypothetical protein
MFMFMSFPRSCENGACIINTVHASSNHVQSLNSKTWLISSHSLFFVKSLLESLVEQEMDSMAW